MNSRRAAIAIKKRRLMGGMLLAIVLAACGGGGGGGSSSGSSGPAPAVYTGLTTQATITSSNANLVTGGAVLSGNAGVATSVTGAQAEALPITPQTRSIVAAQLLRNAMAHVDFTSTTATVSGVTGSGSFPGTCPVNPGSVSYTINLDGNTGDFSGSLAFNGYCDLGDVLTGSANFSGNVNLPLSTPTFTAFTYINLSLPAVSIVSGSDRSTVSGTVGDSSITYASTTLTSERITMTLNVRDDTSGIVVRNENLGLTINYDSPNPGTNTITNISGRFYWPTEGYVDVTSSSDFLIDTTADFPKAGVLVATGKVAPNGSAAGQARLTANSDATTYLVEVDADGDNVFEYSATKNWADL